MSTLKNVFNYESLVHATAGAAGSLFAMSCIYPLDNIKFRMQLQDERLLDKTTLEALLYILKNEGVKSLYRGLNSELTTLGITNFIYFYAFHGLKTVIQIDNKFSTKSDLLLSITAGVLNVLITSPLLVVNNRLKDTANQYNGLIDGLFYIANTEGITSLWSGLSSSLILVSNPAIHFTIYEALKRRSVKKTTIDFLIMSAMSKTVATVLTYPIQLIQAHQRNRQEYNVSTIPLLWTVLKKKGPFALYRGLEAKLMQTVLHAALTFVTYEKIVHYVLLILNRNHKINLP